MSVADDDIIIRNRVLPDYLLEGHIFTEPALHDVNYWVASLVLDVIETCLRTGWYIPTICHWHGITVDTYILYAKVLLPKLYRAYRLAVSTSKKYSL